MVILLIVTRFGSSLSLLVVAAAVTFVPRIIRIVRAAALPFVGKAYVEAARARGERVGYIIGREILPNIRTVLLVDIGGRFTNAILLVAALSFLGLGLKPPGGLGVDGV